MKKCIFLILVLITYYLAGMYRNLSLLLLCVMELLTMAAGGVLPHILIRKLTVSFQKHSEMAETNVDADCHMLVRYTGRLPVSRLSVGLTYSYRTDTKRRKTRLYAGCEKGESVVGFRQQAAWCGIVSLQIKKLKVYDYFSLFSAGKAVEDGMEVAIFPKEQSLRIAWSVPEMTDGSVSEEAAGHVGETDQEIRQIREYQTGDSNRHIHWNLSARTDLLWMKEYERETDFAAHFLLDMQGFASAPRTVLHGFYTVFNAIVLGLLKRMAAVRVYWYDTAAKTLVQEQVENLEQCRKVLLGLYRREREAAGFSAEESRAAKACMPADRYFTLNVALEWFWNETLLHRFSQAEPEREIAEKVFTL